MWYVGMCVHSCRCPVEMCVRNVGCILNVCTSCRWLVKPVYLIIVVYVLMCVRHVGGIM